MRGLYIVIMALIPGIALAAPLTGSTNDNAGGIHVVPGGDDLFIANTGAEYKFDPGFHAKVLDLMREPPSDGDPGVFDGSRYYNVVIVVARDNGDGWDHDKTAAENKVAVVEKLKSLGARDIASARSLSFVTASIPVAEIPGFTLHDEVYKMGDGERRIVHAGGDFKATINAKSDDIRGAIGMDLDGSGVTVAVIDEGINHTTAFKNDQIVRKFCYRDGCNDIGSVYDYNLGAYAHGLGSAQIIAASGLTSNNGIAPGVKLFDLVFDDPVRPENIDNPETVTDEMASFAHALDWAFDNGADIANLSLNGEGHCTDHDNTFNLIANEAVDKGMILVGAVSNHGLVDDGGVDTPEYRSVRDPACAHNVIGVGGIDDSKTDFKMYKKSSRGPVTDDNILKPDLVAPGFGLDLLRYTTGETFDSFEGTSFSTPFVTATAALMLDARPDLTPVMAKAALLLGADWTGPAACTSGMYEKGRTSDGCSYRNQPDDVETANNADSLKILNNVGLGILDTAATLGYVAPGTTHVISDHISVSEPSKKFTFTVDDPTQTKIVLPAGNTTVTFVAEDSSGNAATSSVLVTVEPAVDPARGAAEGRPEPGGPN
ncbi:MAG: S8 family serine peptidase [Nitrosopumilus sp.]|nr:S8 family serine peptidase [Nitrosopumilus sp.]MDA7960108.1 S8 family serine peptidase [Nitrosopumilus sp.]MDA7999652.1 S8 family serine peptidase [Nitrosopumilus sp.]